MKVSEVMTKNVVSVKKDCTIEEIATLLLNKNISGVPVVDDGGKIIGIVTNKDLLYKSMQPDVPAALDILGALIYIGGVDRYNSELKKMTATKAEDIMTKDVITAELDDSVQKIATIMIHNNINRVPIVKGGELVGIVSRSDIIRSMSI